jgi:hypothetical protein
MTRRMSLEDVKKFIEDKYTKLYEPQIEYVPPEEIRDIFLPYVKDTEEFLQFTDDELIEFYTEWYKQNVIAIEKTISEMDLPKIDE